MEEVILSLKDINKSFGNLLVLDNINLDILKNNVHVILGPSGAGKTTLLNIVADIINDYDGRILSNVDLVKGYLFQEDRLIEWMSVYENIELVIKSVYGLKSRKKRIHDLLKRMDLDNFADSYPRELSGGMRQRVAAIRAFVHPSNLLLMDEPFKSLDEESRKRLSEDIIELWRSEPKTIVLVTHHIDEAVKIADYIHIFSKRPGKILKSVKLDCEIELRTSSVLEKYKVDLMC